MATLPRPGVPRGVVGHSKIDFQDHAGRTVTTIYEMRSTLSPPPLLSIHLYILCQNFVESPEDIGKAFLQLPGIVHGNPRVPRIDVYAPLRTLEECMQHHKAEKEYRQLHDGLHIVPTWQKMSSGCLADPWKNVIFVIGENCRCWQDVLDKGLLGVGFDQTMPFEAKVQIYETADSEDEDEGEDEDGLVEVKDWNPEPKIQHLSTRHFRTVSKPDLGFEANEPDNPPGTTLLFHFWSAVCAKLYQCTYQWPFCKRCHEELPHEDCETITDRHYYDINGGCIQCAEEECEMGHGRPWYASGI